MNGLTDRENAVLYRGLVSLRPEREMTALIRVAIVTIIFCISSPTAFAADVRVEVRFSDGEAAIISEWFREHAHEGRNVKGRKALPPGIAKNLKKGKPLPPGLAKQLLPGGLTDRLPPVRDGYERIVVDGKILLVEVATQVIHDILVDAVLK